MRMTFELYKEKANKYKYKMLVVRRLSYFKPNFQKSKLFQKPIVPTRKHIITKAADLNTVSYFVGKSIILFTRFYCTLNWAHYRRLRKDLEDKDKK